MFELNISADKEGNLISPLHDIPLWVDKAQGIANMVVEIPKGTHPKLEMAVAEPLNPIKQDVKVSTCCLRRLIFGRKDS